MNSVTRSKEDITYARVQRIERAGNGTRLVVLPGGEVLGEIWCAVALLQALIPLGLEALAPTRRSGRWRPWRAAARMQGGGAGAPVPAARAGDRGAASAAELAGI